MQVRHPMQAPVLILSAPLSIQLPYDGWPGRAAEGSSSPWAPVPQETLKKLLIPVFGLTQLPVIAVILGVNQKVENLSVFLSFCNSFK